MIQSWASEAYPQPKWEEIVPQVFELPAQGSRTCLTCLASHSPPGKRAAQLERNSGWFKCLTQLSFLHWLQDVRQN